MRGAKAASPLMEMIPSQKCPGLQYMDDVDPGGVADMAGILKGDFLLEVSCRTIRDSLLIYNTNLKLLGFKSFHFIFKTILLSDKWRRCKTS